MRNQVSKVVHRLEELEQKLNFVLRTVQVTIQFNNPADPNFGKAATVPLQVLYDEIKRVKALDAEFSRDDDFGGEDYQAGGPVDGSPSESPSDTSPAPANSPSISPSGLIITG